MDAYEYRTYAAILSEFVPNWPEVAELGPAMFAQRWMQETGQNRSSGFRWYHRAIAVRDAQLADAA